MESRSKTNLKDICCLALSFVLQSKVHFPGSPDYTASLGSYTSLQEIELQPQCIVAPKSTQDVSTAVRILTTTTLAGSSRRCQFAIQSGGHSTFAGYANIEGGVTLDLSALNSITVQEPSSPNAAPVVSVGTGARWGAVYSALDPLNLSVNGGRADSVGVGGLTLSSGLSFFGPQYGWTCDTVTDLKVVLFNSRIVNINSNSNSNLLWALLGGTNNFSVVTRGGQTVHTIDTLDAQMSFLASFSDPATYDEYSSLITSFAYNNPATGGPGISVIASQIEYTQPVANPPAFQPLTEGLSTPLFTTQQITNLTDLTTENNSVPSISHIPGIIWTVVIDPLPPQLYSEHSDSGRANALGLGGARHGNESLMIVQLWASWSTPTTGNAEQFDEAVDLAARKLIADVETAMRALGALDRFVYANYAAPWQDAFAIISPSIQQKK
ncbi:hypothetical protein V8F06_014169 [Rhypophila decipiens]